MRHRLTALLFGAVLLVGAQVEDSPEAVLMRTKTTQATYTAYEWNAARDEEGNPSGEWAAEFHSGDWHRLEVPRVRIVANCRTHEGYSYDVKSNTSRASDTAWLGACGIDTAGQIIAVDRMPSIQGKNGRLDVIRIKGTPWLRYYAVDRNGVIVQSNRVAPNGSPAPCLQNRAVAILSSLPTKDMFSRASLARSFVPDRYRQPPKGPPPPGLAGTRCV